MSKEGVLPLSEFRMASNGIGTSGPVVVEGNVNTQGEVVALSVQAFGMTRSIDTSILKTLNLAHANGIQLSYEAGYRVLGGKTIYILFQKGFTSEIKEKFVLAVSENEVPKMLDEDLL